MPVLASKGTSFSESYSWLEAEGKNERDQD
jgi:hypothetical protein